MISNVLAKITMIFVLACALALASKIPLRSDQIICVVAGVCVTIIFALVWFRFTNWTSNATRPGRPQTITLHTDDTPSQITWAAIRATLTLSVVFGFTLFAFVVIMSNVLGIDLVRSLRSIFGL